MGQIKNTSQEKRRKGVFLTKLFYKKCVHKDFTKFEEKLLCEIFKNTLKSICKQLLLYNLCIVSIYFAIKSNILLNRFDNIYNCISAVACVDFKNIYFKGTLSNEPENSQIIICREKITLFKVK